VFSTQIHFKISVCTGGQMYKLLVQYLCLTPFTYPETNGWKLKKSQRSVCFQGAELGICEYCAQVVQNVSLYITGIFSRLCNLHCTFLMLLCVWVICALKNDRAKRKELFAL